MKDIKEVANKLNLKDDDCIFYGKDILKIVKNVSNEKKDSKLILVTAISPTKYGEGKTTVTIGLNDSLCNLGKNSIAVLREPSLGPVFGLKGGATGGGCAKVVPEDKINLHFTGDFHAITSANNLLCAAIDNHVYQGNELNINENTILVKRCLDVNDRSLRNKFNITAASEVMAIFCLSSDREDLRNRLSNILVGYNKSNEPIYARDLKVDGAMYNLLEDAFNPNLVQSLDGNPVLIHGGPFANIAHGCSSIVSTKLALNISNYVITEAGFGSELGCEKFIDITSRIGQFHPSMIVLTATVRALKYNGIDNLQAHIDNLNNYNIPFCVALNHFFEDKNEDIEEIVKYCNDRNIKCFVCDPYNTSTVGCDELAKYISEYNYCDIKVNEIYPMNAYIQDKMNLVASNVYHASCVKYSDEALKKIDEIERLGIRHYPICVCKTPNSISDNPEILGYPKNYTITVKDIIIETGSRMLIMILNNVVTMPGLPKNPRYIEME